MKDGEYFRIVSQSRCSTHRAHQVHQKNITVARVRAMNESIFARSSHLILKEVRTDKCNRASWWHWPWRCKVTSATECDTSSADAPKIKFNYRLTEWCVVFAGDTGDHRKDVKQSMDGIKFIVAQRGSFRTIYTADYCRYCCENI